MDTPTKHKTAADGYQTQQVGEVGKVPSMGSKQVTDPPARGAADITKNVVTADVIYD